MSSDAGVGGEKNEGVTGIVLAGGASTRFGADKLVATFDGRPILERAIDAIGAASAEVLVVVAPGDDRALPAAAGPTRVPVRRIEDPESFGGPLVGLLAGLEQAREPLALVAGGDMPSLNVDVLRALLHELTRSRGTVEAAVLVRQGAGRPLPAALRNGAATQATRRLLGQDERRLRALLRELRTSEIPEADWRSLDPDGDTLRDVDTPEDLRT
jgi:molybdopterin-guanine dinucleotide biosynthesis protein A